jgi:hypothetical protein
VVAELMRICRRRWAAGLLATVTTLARGDCGTNGNCSPKSSGVRHRALEPEDAAVARRNDEPLWLVRDRLAW